MPSLVHRFFKDESGVTALESAIILIAFVVVAAIFSFTILSTGTFLTERSKEAAYSGLQEVRGSMAQKGSVVLTLTGHFITFDVAMVAGGSSVDLTRLGVTYRDNLHVQNIAYLPGATDPPDLSSQFIVTNPAGDTGLTNLGAGQLASLWISPPVAVSTNTTFSIEVRPQAGGVLVIQRTAPAQITDVTDLH
jgi:archaeal flagellin FlaB